MVTNAGDSVIVRSTIELAHKMGLIVVAEGIEDAVTLEQLREMGCDVVQGYHVSSPLDAEEFATWVRNSRWTRGISGAKESASSGVSPAANEGWHSPVSEVAD